MKLFFWRVLWRTTLLAAFVPALAAAQNDLRGTVMNTSTNEKVVGAIVRIEDSYLNALTDENGHFEFKVLKQSSVVLTVSHLSFGSQQVQVALPSPALNVSLVPRVITAEEVTVTALRADEHSGIAYTTVTKEEIEAQNLGHDL